MKLVLSLISGNHVKLDFYVDARARSERRIKEMSREEAENLRGLNYSLLLLGVNYEQPLFFSFPSLLLFKFYYFFSGREEA